MPTISVWSFDDPALSAPPLTADVKCDVCMIGGGVAGLTTAYLLATEGKQVVLLEAQPGLADGETRYTTAHLAWVLDDRFARLASIRGDNVARAAADSHRAAIGMIGEIVAREQIDCDFRRVDGYLFPGKDGPDAVLDEADALRRLGISFSMIDDPPAPEVAGPSLKFTGQGQFHPRKYLAGLTTAIRKHGEQFTPAHAHSDRWGSPCTVRRRREHDHRLLRGGRHERAVRRGRIAPRKLAAYTYLRLGNGGHAGSCPTPSTGTPKTLPLRSHHRGPG